jgi:uncharacterized heparinase superfamily protein
MLNARVLDRLKRVLKKPPRYVFQRITQEVWGQTERYVAPRRARRLSAIRLAKRTGYTSVAQWWDALAARPFLAQTKMSHLDLERVCAGGHARILKSAERAIAHKVDLLGSGLIELGADIDWQRDYKTGIRWPQAYCRDIEYNNPDRPSDVKFPWELSRMQWMMPLGQAYLLTQEDHYAVAARDLLSHWISANPYAGSVNWSCTMEVALRIHTWTWFFHVFKHSTAWTETVFREHFLQSLYLHGDFTARNLEKSDVNGNHYTADAAGLVFAGLFFGCCNAAQHWLKLGWDILCDEMPLQVYPDGVDFEASVPYHRLVQELFLLPALYRLRHGLEVPQEYRERLIAMARFTAAYSRPDGSVPLWGDADDARALPFGGQPINDHRYLLGVVGAAFNVKDLLAEFSGPRSEILWLMGAAAASSLPDRGMLDQNQSSIAFPDGGFYVLRNRRDHVFVDCGPLGLGGRGGHGHNDLLSFEAVLDGVHLISDCGAYLYTANYQERNNFRSTAYHNTPRVDGEEINRFVRPDYLWFLHNDAVHEVREVNFGPNTDQLILSHGGYRRLKSPVTPVRRYELNHTKHRLTILDEFEGEGEHQLEITLHLASGVEVDHQESGRVVLRVGKRSFSLDWASTSMWNLRIEPGRISPSYGLTLPSVTLIWLHTGPLSDITVTLQPMPVVVVSDSSE